MDSGFSNGMDYEKLLKKARDEMPEAVFIKERFEIPKIKGHIQGSKTVLVNLNQIANDFQRPVEHLLKYITKELGTPGVMKNNTAILAIKVPASRINEKIRNYANEFVLCHECGKPDTKIIKEGMVNYLKCMACAAKHQVRSRI
jgi:translation initiation factor 2 subunit 2